MASFDSPQKRASTSSRDIAGYIVECSPVKISKSNNKYFNAKLQTSEENVQTVVSFSAERHGDFRKAMSGEKAIQLKNVSFVAGRCGTENDIRLTRQSTIEYSSVPFNKKVLQEAEKKDLASVAKMNSHQTVRFH